MKRRPRELDLSVAYDELVHPAHFWRADRMAKPTFACERHLFLDERPPSLFFNADRHIAESERFIVFISKLADDEKLTALGDALLIGREPARLKRLIADEIAEREIPEALEDAEIALFARRGDAPSETRIARECDYPPIANIMGREDRRGRAVHLPLRMP